MEENNKMFICDICDIHKLINETFIKTNEICICNNCNIKGKFQKYCDKCFKQFSFEEIKFLSLNYKKVIKCVSCIADLNDKKLELIFLNYKYNNIYTENKYTLKNDINYKSKYEELIQNINNFLDFVEVKKIDEAEEIFLNQKNYINMINKIIFENNLSGIEEISKIIEEKNKYKKKYKNLQKLLKEDL